MVAHRKEASSPQHINYKCVILLYEMARNRTIDSTGNSAAVHLIAVRFTAAQALKVRKQAKREGISVSEFVRLRTLGKAA
jgi:hypothetical protein